MKKYLALYMAPIESFDEAMASSQDDMKEAMAAWQSWMDQHKDAIVDGGGPLGKSKKVTKEGGEDHRNTLGGYSVVQAESLDAAAKLFDTDHPHFMMRGAWVELVEFVDMPSS